MSRGATPAIRVAAAQDHRPGTPDCRRASRRPWKRARLPVARTKTGGTHSLRAENLAIACLDFLSLRLHRRWIAFHELDRGQRPASGLLLHKRMERAHSGGADQDLLRLGTEQVALEQPRRVGIGRALEDTARSASHRGALGRIDGLYRRAPLLQ